jgi:hypothetical protein
MNVHPMKNLDPQVQAVYTEYGHTMAQAQLGERHLIYTLLAKTEPSEEYETLRKQF